MIEIRVDGDVWEVEPIDPASKYLCEHEESDCPNVGTWEARHRADDHTAVHIFCLKHVKEWAKNSLDDLEEDST